MKAISLWQPWATLMAIGAKRIETRSWPTSHRGPLLIHAAKKWDGELMDIAMSKTFHKYLATNDPRRSLPFGSIVAKVNIVDCIQSTEDNAPDGDEYYFGDYSYGRYQWITDGNPARFAPIPFKGSQGFFDVPDELLSLTPIPARREE